MDFKESITFDNAVKRAKWYPFIMTCFFTNANKRYSY